MCERRLKRRREEGRRGGGEQGRPCYIIRTLVWPSAVSVTEAEADAEAEQRWSDGERKRETCALFSRSNTMHHQRWLQMLLQCSLARSLSHTRTHLCTAEPWLWIQSVRALRYWINAILPKQACCLNMSAVQTSTHTPALTHTPTQNPYWSGTIKVQPWNQYDHNISV